MSILTSSRPAEPNAEGRPGWPRPSSPPAAEILELSHRIHADPEPAFEEHHAAAWVAEALARHGFEVEAPAGSLATAVRAVKRGGRRRWSSDRDPRRVRRAAGPRPRLRPQHDGRVGRRCRDRPRLDRRRAARRDRLPRLSGRGTRQRQEGDDRRRPVRGSRRGAAVPPLRPQPRLQLAARVRGHRRRLHRPPGARVVGSVDGQERARRDDPAVQLGRPLAPAAPAARPVSTGSSRRAGTAANIIPERTRAWFMLRSHGAGVLRDHEDPVPADVRGRRPGDRHDRRRGLLGWRDDDEQQPSPR